MHDPGVKTSIDSCRIFNLVTNALVVKCPGIKARRGRHSGSDSLGFTFPRVQVSAPVLSAKAGTSDNIGHPQAGCWVPGAPGAEQLPRFVGSCIPPSGLMHLPWLSFASASSQPIPLMLQDLHPGPLLTPVPAAWEAAWELWLFLRENCRDLARFTHGSGHPGAVHSTKSPSRVQKWSLISSDAPCSHLHPSARAVMLLDPSLLTPFPLFPARLKCHNKCTKEAPPCHLLIIHRGGKDLPSSFCLG